MLAWILLYAFDIVGVLNVRDLIFYVAEVQDLEAFLMKIISIRCNISRLHRSAFYNSLI